MRKKRTIRLILYVLLLALVVIQFIPVDRSVPEVDPGQDLLAISNTPEQMRSLIKDACYDCHSYETEYPWYAYVAPVSMWLQGHVDHGRGHLNFSTWTAYDADEADHKLEEIGEEVGEGHMPLKSFIWMHPEAKLSDEQRAVVILPAELIHGTRQFPKTLKSGTRI
jgi:hypothetical protein